MKSVKKVNLTSDFQLVFCIVGEKVSDYGNLEIIIRNGWYKI